MRTRLFAIATILILGGLCVATNAGVIVQQEGTDFLVVQAEDYDEIEGDEFTGFLEVERGGDEETDFGSQLLPDDSNVSGTAMFDQLGNSNFVDLLNYRLQFATPGIYTMYMRYSLFQMSDPIENYANEDSFYLPLEMNELAEQDGWFSLPTLGNNDTESGFWEGQFHWAGPFTYQVSGEPIEYVIGEGDLGTAVDFQIGTREHGSTLDAIIFSRVPDLFEEELDELLEDDPPVPGDFNDNGSLDVADIDALVAESAAMTNNPGFDLNADNLVNVADVTFWAKDLANTWIGDANLDGEFNSSDFVAVFTAGKFETEAAANWSEGDWNGDGVFSSGDFVSAFTDGGFELGPRPQAAASVPEPATFVLGGIGMILMAFSMRRRR